VLQHAAEFARDRRRGANCGFFYSGDTRASRPDTRGGATFAGTRLVIRKMFYEKMRRLSDGGSIVGCYTINSTSRGYKLTSSIFREYVPTRDGALSPADTRVVAELCRLKGLAFDPATGIVKLRETRRCRWKRANKRPADPYIRFCFARMPGQAMERKTRYSDRFLRPEKPDAGR
jgi:hypothetical protein